VVASQVYHWEVTLREIITLINKGTLGGTSFKANLANGGEVIEFNPDYAIPADAKALADTTIKGIIDGTIKITLP
jgi:basic membrane lipoprotein Med (substrate-binding protein (PBP1-ABC) superfamily)